MNPPTPHLPTPLQEYVHKSRYAKWIDSASRREHWPETVQRYVDYFNKFPHFPKEDVYDAILKLDVMPSMRALMTAGPALERDPMAGFNPVSGDTVVVTREFGNVPIKTLQGKSASVLNKNGEWANAAFNSYGVQPLKRVVLGLNSNGRREVFATANHRWILSDGTVVSTDQLQAGDHIDFVSAPKAELDADYALGIRHGIVYGDGTVSKSQQRVKGYMVRLCGSGKDFLSYFDGYPVSYPPSANGDPIVMLYDEFAATHALKELPSADESESYLLGFIRGWLSTDGCISKRDSQATLCCNEQGKNWLYRYAERAGFVLQGFSIQPRTTNYGDRKEDSFVVRISRSSLSTEDILSGTKQQNLKPLASKFHVRMVEDTDRIEEVFCAEVPDTNTFVLAGGLVTGNCSFVAVDDVRAFDEILYILMCFHPDTLVVTRTGTKRIADVQIGDEVSTIEEATGRSLWKRVTNRVKTPSAQKPKVEVALENGHTVKCTADHKWLTTNRGWVEAGKLTTNDDLVAPKWQIYRVTNTVNGKAYIGQTRTGAMARFREHRYTALNTKSDWHFAKALRKWDASVWNVEVIDYAFSAEEAHEKERQLIAQFDTVALGYNSTIGGEGAPGYEWTPEQRQRASENAYERTDEHRDAQREVLAKAQEKIASTRQTLEYRDAQRERNLGARNPMYGRKHSDGRKAQIRQQMAGPSNPFFGKKHSEESKQKIRDTKARNAAIQGAAV